MTTHSDRVASERSDADETDASSTATVSTVESHARPGTVRSRRLRDRIEVAIPGRQ